ncbi:hypothetical protein [Aliirhizobium smilacinae]|uniref:Mobilization protein n=1 Tax=Aliirhizobium smilacinae TaxID=1395944 RepID=A0A5C4XI54_9HYPH|nr:hypothetical protein [Rhizobium smilacinae]TNM63042.1 hypothetical protein FHP24_17685 [Rhizobium smilacinae]
MRKVKKISISTKVSMEDYAAVRVLASQRNLSLASFLRLSALKAGEMEPVYRDDDRRLLLYLREELRDEGCRLTDLVRTLNVENLPVDGAIKAGLVTMQRTIAALCVELSVHRKELLKQQPQGDRDGRTSSQRH